jgi:uncharacterized membrane protein YraQ (UPF0718 family)
MELFPSGRRRLSIEKFNLSIISLFFIIAILCLFFERGPSTIIRQIVGKENGSDLPVLTFIAFTMLFGAFVISPILILLYNYQDSADKQARALLKILENKK